MVGQVKRLLSNMTLNRRNELELVDICCRMISDVKVTLQERMWLHDYVEHNAEAKELAGALLCPYKVEDK